MKANKTRRALCALLLSLALLCGMFTAVAEEEIVLSNDEPIVEEAAEEADEEALELEELPEGPDDIIVEDLPLDLTLDDGLVQAEPELEALELPDDLLSNEETDTPTPAADAVPLVATYNGGPLTKVFDCNKYGAYLKDGKVVYIIPEIKTIKSLFTLAPAPGYDWVDGHESVTFKLSITHQFNSPDVGSYEFSFKITLTGDDASYYTLNNAEVKVPATITPREVIVTPRTGLSKTYGTKDPVYPANSWLSKDESSPLHQDISGLPGYAVPVNTKDGKLTLTVTNAAYILNNAKQKGTKFFTNNGFLSRVPGEDVGKYRITLGDLEFGPNFSITLQEEYFTIFPKDISASNVTVGAISDKYYTGKSRRPTPAVTYGSNTLTPDQDYTVHYSNNKYPGRATATITGIGNFTGTRKVNFKIVLRPTSISRLAAGKGQVKVTWKKGKHNSGYQIAYSRKSSFSTKTTKTVKGISKTRLTVKGLKSKKTYYFRIRTYKTVHGKKYYSAWSKTRKIRTK